MHDRIERWLRVAGFLLVALAAVQLLLAVRDANPLAKVVIPPLPTLASTNTPPSNVGGEAPVSPMGVPTNPADSKPKATDSKVGTNNVNSTPLPKVAASAVPSNLPPAKAQAGAVKPVNVVTNPMANTGTNGTTNVVMTASAGGTNGPGAKARGTNLVAAVTTGTSSNHPALAVAPAEAAAKRHAARVRHGMPGGFMGGMMGRMGGAASPLSPESQARVDKIVNSEIFAPVFHPIPMALMGIAGDTAFIRTPSGQTGLVKPGDSLGEVKLVRIGTNRVLVEVNGEKQELLIFEGYGGESLLSTNKDK